MHTILNYLENIKQIMQTHPSLLFASLFKCVYLGPCTSPVLNMTSSTPTTVSIEWEQTSIVRNGNISRYVVTLCLAASTTCLLSTTINDTSIRNLTLTGLIPRFSYIISIRADVSMGRSCSESFSTITTPTTQG